MNTLMELGKNCRVTELTASDIAVRKEELGEFLAPAFACAHGELGATEALTLCEGGKAWCFIGEINEKLTALLIAEFVDYPLIRVLNVLAYSGSARHFYPFMQVLKTWGKLNGASEIRGCGGESQMRLARRVHGFQEIYRVYSLPI